MLYICYKVLLSPLPIPPHTVKIIPNQNRYTITMLLKLALYGKASYEYCFWNPHLHINNIFIQIKKYPLKGKIQYIYIICGAEHHCIILNSWYLPKKGYQSWQLRVKKLLRKKKFFKKRVYIYLWYKSQATEKNMSSNLMVYDWYLLIGHWTMNIFLCQPLKFT